MPPGLSVCVSVGGGGGRCVDGCGGEAAPGGRRTRGAGAADARRGSTRGAAAAAGRTPPVRHGPSHDGIQAPQQRTWLGGATASLRPASARPGSVLPPWSPPPSIRGAQTQHRRSRAPPKWSCVFARISKISTRPCLGHAVALAGAGAAAADAAGHRVAAWCVGLGAETWVWFPRGGSAAERGGGSLLLLLLPGERLVFDHCGRRPCAGHLSLQALPVRAPTPALLTAARLSSPPRRRRRFPAGAFVGTGQFAEDLATLLKRNDAEPVRVVPLIEPAAGDIVTTSTKIAAGPVRLVRRGREGGGEGRGGRGGRDPL